MASSSTIKSFQQNQAQEDEVEHFDDFTIASSWERFISDIEAICRQWLADGSKNLLKKGATQVEISNNLYKVKSELKHASKTYSLEYYFENGNDGKVAEWNLNLHDLQLCFGVKDFLVIAPQSASGVILDSPEASKLLSAVAIALSNCSSLWPAFVPVHDPTRKAFIGIQNMGTIFTRRFEADRMGSQVPVKLLHLEGLYELFVSKFAYSSLDLSVHLFKVFFTMKLTYRILPYNDDEVERADAEITESGLGSSTSTHNNAQWDDDCSWSDWYSAEDPIKGDLYAGFELVTIWSENMVENSMTMAELENFSPHESKKWILFPILSPNITNSLEGNRIGFSSQLSHLIDTLVMSFEAQFMEDFISVENPTSDNLKSSMVLPPPTAIDRVLKELFHNGGKHAGFSKSDSRTIRGIKGAPMESLFAHFCLHALWFGNCNIRAIALFWIEFVREIRWYWEESQPLPRMPVSGSIDLSTCLINQKLQMLAICIDQKRQLNEEYLDCLESQDLDSSSIEEDGLTPEESFIMHTPGETFDGNLTGEINSSDEEQESVRNELKSGTKSGEGLSTPRRPADMIRRGSAGVVGNMVLLNSSQSLHAPFTQDAPLMTEDMHEERLKAVEIFGDSFNFSAQLEKDILASDMQAFKAANPDAVFEDFIRWHSPGDWVDDHTETSGASTSRVSKENLPPRGHLSKRMSEHGNLWRQIWNEAPALPVSEQKPLLDPNREGEKIIHYLETLRPHLLLEQMVCTAFKASADTLNQTSYGGLKQMKTKMDQLYATMASVLKSLQVNRVFSESEITEDLKRLCVVFEHVEKLLTLAASLHRKLGQAPRLTESIFKDFYDFYLPRMGSGSIKIKDQQNFDKKQPVRSHERPVVSNLFTPPTANQSWRKVLSMGNLLNGHEPILREIIFSTRDSMSGNHYAATTPAVQEKEIETHRMYVCGSSNDLRVALSVASCD